MAEELHRSVLKRICAESGQFMLNTLFIAAAIASNFITYPGFNNPAGIIEMTTDKGLILEIVLRCSRKENGQISSGIMSYSKVEKLYCSSRNRCYRDAKKAAEETCGR